MIQKIGFTILLIFSLSACGTAKTAANARINIKKLELGMTKKEIVSIMGKEYTPIGLVQTERGGVEMISYITGFDHNYVIHLLDDKLVEWNREEVHNHHTPYME